MAFASSFCLVFLLITTSITLSTTASNRGGMRDNSTKPNVQTEELQHIWIQPVRPRRPNVLWDERMMIDLMKSWNQSYRGHRASRKALYKTWAETSSGKQYNISERTLAEKANELLTRGFTIPAEHNNGRAIRLTQNVKNRRDLGSVFYIETPESEHIGESSQSHNQYKVLLYGQTLFEHQQAAYKPIQQTYYSQHQHEASSSTQQPISPQLELGIPISSSATNPNKDEFHVQGRKRKSIAIDSEYSDSWLYLNSANNPFFNNIHHRDGSGPSA